ncbi:MAG: membrane dipeptidase [Acidobacteria bacterium]|nr:membrane dipeptidase [Acidobacteriota bacterium]
MRQTVRTIPATATLALAAVFLPGCNLGTPEERAERALLATATEIHERVITLDSHIDIPLIFATREVDPGVDGDFQVDLPKMRAGGLDAGFWIVYVGQTERTPENEAQAKADARTKFDAIHRMAEQMYPDEISIAYSADDVERIAAEGKLVALIGIENGWAIGRDLALVETYHGLGARYMTLAHSGHNDIADSATTSMRDPDAEVVPEHDGVSPFGEEVIAEMNRVGMLVDVSHISKAAMLDAVRLSTVPVIASHSSMRALMDMPRNLDDEQLRALAENGGVVQVVALGAFLTESGLRHGIEYQNIRDSFGMIPGQPSEELGAEPHEDYLGRVESLNRRWPDATVADFVDHIDYAVELIGIDHVGISSDFDGGGGVVGWSDASETLNVTVELVRRGYSEEEIAKLWGGNLLRVLREAEQAAGR